ncbi:32918_t:CDS:2, partial [Gigaspora margarita]
KRGPKTNSPFLHNNNPGETAIKALFSSNSSNFENPNPYNNNIIATEALNKSIDQSSLPHLFPFVHEELTKNNDSIILSSTSHLEGLAQNDDSLIISPSQNGTTYLNDSSSLEFSDPYNNIITSPNIDNYGINEAFRNALIDQSFLHPSSPSDQSSLPSFFPFVHEELTQNNDPSIINPYQNIILSSTSHLESSTSAQTPFNIHLHRVSEIFPNTPPSAHTPSSTHEGLTQNNGPLNISPSQNAIPTSIIYLNDSSSLETSDLYNNIITFPNIDNYGTNEAFQNAFIDQSFLHPSSPFIHEESMQNNDHLNIDLFSNINYPNTIPPCSLRIMQNNNL